MGFTGSGIFSNDHSLDVLDTLVDALERQIEEGVSAVEQADTMTGEEDEWQGYDLLVSLDEHVLAPIALLAALCSDPVVQAMRPDRMEVQRWQEAVQRSYDRIQHLEQQQAPRPEGSMLFNQLPGKAPSPAFWTDRERQTEDVFRRLVEASPA